MIGTMCVYFTYAAPGGASEAAHAEEQHDDDAEARIKAIEEAEAKASQEAEAAEAALLARYGKQA